jgi:putative hydrolase of HD superfamily
MEKPDISRTIAFTRLIHAFQEVERVAHAPDKVRHENDVEHSYILAMLAWYLVDSLKLPLDKNKVLQYALAHDFVEVYAGDTNAFSKIQSELDSKHQREEDARIRIKEEFPEFEDLHNTIVRYESKADDESIFVNKLDKLLPVITNYIQDGVTWKEMDLPFDVAFENKRRKIGDHQPLRPFLEEIIILIEQDRAKYFKS